MFIYSLLVFLYTIMCVFLVIIILMQKSKGSVTPIHQGGMTQMIFGGSGGQDLFQKVTWVLGFLFMASSFALALLRAQQTHSFRYINEKNKIVQNQTSAAIQPQVAPVEPSSPQAENQPVTP